MKVHLTGAGGGWVCVCVEGAGGGGGGGALYVSISAHLINKYVFFIY